MTTSFLALDQSTSATKALLFDASGSLVDREAREHRQHYPQPGWVEHDADEIWEHVRATAGALVRRHPERPIAWLSVTNQRETVVVFDRRTGRPLHPAIVWQCRRGDALCAEHAAAGRGALVQERTGLRLDGYFSGSKLQWLVRQRPDLRARLESGEAVIGTIDAYLVHRLTQGAVFATDSTNASRTLLFDIGRLRWDPELCALWEVPMASLPEVRESSARFGETTIDGALAQPVPIRGVMGDSQAALFAHRCVRPGMAKGTFGTGSSLLLNIGSTLRRPGRGIVTALAWVEGGVPTYAFEGVVVSSAATLTWLRDQLGLFKEFAEIEPLAAAVPDNEGVYLVPAFSGLGLPHWKLGARAAIVGLSARSDRRHIIRAAVESIAYQTRDALDAMRSEAGLPLVELHADGGSTANRFLMQFMADVTRVNLKVPAISECSPLGAALAGAIGMGAIETVNAISKAMEEGAIYRPSPNAGYAEKLYEGWQSAVSQVIGAG